ncbi:MAG: RIP metalloprotease [Asticcacaulis sp.]
MNLLISIVTFILLISVIVTIHELGHFSVARLFKTKVDRFSVGFGPILWSRRDKNGVLWCISALPLGGYVKFSGDEHVASMSPTAEDLDLAREAIAAREGYGAEKAYFHFKPVWQRFLIVAAGPLANFVLAIALFAIIFSVVGKVTEPATVSEVRPGSVAEAAGFQVGDSIVRIDGRKIERSQDVVMLIHLRADTPVEIDVLRDNKLVSIVATPARTLVSGPNDHVPVYGGQLGVGLSEGERVKLAPHQAVMSGVQMTGTIIDTTVTYIGRIFTGKENGNQLSGVVGMTKATGDVTAEIAAAKATNAEKARVWILSMIQMAAVISVGIGFINLLPIPVLDGGHLVFYTFEAIFRKPLSAAVQGIGYRFGLIALLGLMLFATWNDLNRIGLVKFFGGLFS